MRNERFRRGQAHLLDPRPWILILCGTLLSLPANAMVHGNPPGLEVVRYILDSRLIVVGRLSDKKKDSVQVRDSGHPNRDPITKRYEWGIVRIEKTLLDLRRYPYDAVWVYWNEPDGIETSSVDQPRCNMRTMSCT